MKVLVISHAHPSHSVGGAETAAYNLFNALIQNDETTHVTFLARTDLQSVAPGMIKFYRNNEYLWRQDIGDWFCLRAKYRASLEDEFRVFLAAISPDVVFVQHYAHMGVDILHTIRSALPDAVVTLTLHEYLAICNRNGQFVKNKTKNLCFEESISSCAICFDDRTSGDFWLRKHYIIRNFEGVDAFISPSAFLKTRYVEWGIAPDLVHVIENGQPTSSASEFVPARLGERVRFGYFGQITEYKGVDILLKALGAIPEAIRQGLVLELHGANLEFQGQWFRELIEELRKPLEDEGCLRWAGPYQPHELSRRMSKVDWVVVPSIWWENSPMVIQEAFVHRKPVICSNIGGMAEKVRNEIDGLHFEVRNPLELADVMARAAVNRELCYELSVNIRQPPSYAECAKSHLALVKKIREAA